jgi:hypothetical protein
VAPTASLSLIQHAKVFSSVRLAKKVFVLIALSSECGRPALTKVANGQFTRISSLADALIAAQVYNAYLRWECSRCGIYLHKNSLVLNLELLHS